MDWKKYFGPTGKDDQDKHSFKKFDYEDDDDDFSDLETFFNEFHGNKFNFDGFPPHILRQFQEVLEAMDGLHRGDDNDLNRKRLADKYFEFKEHRDTDLDGKVYAEQLDSLLKRFSPDLMLKDEPKKNELNFQQSVKKLTDEEKIMDKIHGTFKEEVRPATTLKPNRKGQVQKAPMSPHHFGALPPFHEFPPPSSQSKTWGKTFISIRKSDGTSETRHMEQTPQGMKTTITKTNPDGHSSTQTFMGDDQSKIVASEKQIVTTGSKNHEERNLIDYNGYKIPCLF